MIATSPLVLFAHPSVAFHDEASPEREHWVGERLLNVLRGRAVHVAAGMRRSATLRGLSAKRRKPPIWVNTSRWRAMVAPRHGRAKFRLTAAITLGRNCRLMLIAESCAQMPPAGVP